MFYSVKHKFGMLTPAEMAANDIAQAERDLYDARKRHEDTQAVIDLHEGRIARLRDQYQQPKGYNAEVIKPGDIKFVLPVDQRPGPSSVPFVKRVRAFMGQEHSGGGVL